MRAAAAAENTLPENSVEAEYHITSVAFGHFGSGNGKRHEARGARPAKRWHAMFEHSRWWLDQKFTAEKMHLVTAIP